MESVEVEYDHPIWVLYSSGTTGRPKSITHRTGGMLMEHYKAIALHQNLKRGDRFFWHTTTGWMMWNYALGALLCGEYFAYMTDLQVILILMFNGVLLQINLLFILDMAHLFLLKV